MTGLPVSSIPLAVLHLDHTDARGGAEYALLRILIAPHDWRPLVLLPGPIGCDLGTYAPLLLVKDVSVRRLGPAQNPGANRATPVVLARMIARALGQSMAIRFSKEFRTARLVHTNTSRAAVYGAVACIFSRTPLVVHLRDAVNRNALGGAGFHMLTRLALRRATGVIANSTSTLETARRYLARDAHVVVIPSAAGLRDRPRPVPAEASTATSSVARVGMLARIDPWKGQAQLIRAFARSFAGAKVRLILAGEPAFGHADYLVELKALANQLGVAEQVDFVGHIEDVNALIDSLDVCVQASTRAEPLGQNILQYLSAGKTVIATAEGGPAEWIRDGHNGLLVEPRSVDALAAALSRVASDHALRGRLAVAAASTPGLRTDSQIAAEHAAFFSLCAAPNRASLRRKGHA